MEENRIFRVTLWVFILFYMFSCVFWIFFSEYCFVLKKFLHFKNSFRLIAKLRGRYWDFPYKSSPDTFIASPILHTHTYTFNYENKCKFKKKCIIWGLRKLNVEKNLHPRTWTPNNYFVGSGADKIISCVSHLSLMDIYTVVFENK